MSYSVTLLIVATVLNCRIKLAESGYRGNCSELGSDFVKCFPGPPNYWSSCVSNSYVQIHSGNDTKMCPDNQPYCEYTCQEEGILTDDCGCGEPGNHTMLTLDIPSRCYDPMGSNCSWYADCLQAQHPCNQTTGNPYALPHGEHYCNLTQALEDNDKFSAEGVLWAEAVRRCRQVALVPLLRPWHSPTCKQIENIAFSTHVDCYSNSANDSLMFQNLNSSDFWLVYWTIHRSNISNPTKALNNFVHAALTYQYTHWETDAIKWIKLTLRFWKGCFFKKTKDTDYILDLTREVVHEIIRILDWGQLDLNCRGLSPDFDTSYVYAPPKTDILLGIWYKQSEGQTTAPIDPPRQLQTLVSELMEAFTKGSLRKLSTGEGYVAIVDIVDCATPLC